MNLCFGIESLALDATQRNALIDALKLIGAPNKTRPCDICHWRIRPDGQAAIFEADFPSDHITISAMKTRLGVIFGVDPATITHTTAQSAYGPVVTLKRNATSYLRILQFGGATPTLEESREAVRAFLKANQAEWEPAQ